VYFLGPGDLAVLMGFGHDPGHAEVWQTIERCIRTIKARRTVRSCNSGFVYAEYSPEADCKHSYWGVGYPTNQDEGDAESAMLCGQKMARDVPKVSEADGWRAIEFLVEGLVGAADKAGVRLACHPHDPAYPIGGLNGVEHVMGSADGIRRFLKLSPSKNHGLNFCQGTVAEMFKGPGKAMIPIIEEFASTGRIFMVHFRNIHGGYLDFQEVFPDEGDVDMFEAIRAYQRGGYQWPPVSKRAKPRPTASPGSSFHWSFCRSQRRSATRRCSPGDRSRSPRSPFSSRRSRARKDIAARYADRHRRDADQRRRALRADQERLGRLHSARCAARGRHHAVPQDLHACRPQGPPAGDRTM
jgi:D-mannonate dehydratase (UxuA)